MKIRFSLIASFITICSFYGCDDNTGSLGLGMLPGSDNINVLTKTFDVDTKTILSDSIFAKTNIGYIGKFRDPEFGTYEAGFLTQLNCTNNFKFPFDVMAGDTTYLTELVLYYPKRNGYFGDSLNTCRMSVYGLNKILDKNHYTSIDPKNYYNESDLLGQKAYTAVNLSLSDSLRSSSNFTPYVRFVLPKEFGDSIIKQNKEHPEYFENAQKFIDHIFKGIYVKTDYGEGTILYVDKVNLNVVYNAHYTDSLGNFLKKKDGTDSLYYGKRTFAATKEVIQANQFVNSKQALQSKANETDTTYIKSPAGLFTQATLPIQQIADELSQDTLNAVKLVFKHYAQEKKNQYSMMPPEYVLLLRKEEMNTFFEQNKLPDNVTSYLAKHNASGINQYVFSNLSKLISTCIAEKKATQEVVLIPVSVTTITDTQQRTTIASIQHDMKPEYAKFEGGNNKLKLEIVYSHFETK
ncbi:DUF4270 domain-containing protein [uncultured Bacteroides sp.]|uniref:DUF4270 domain-containing protein n=1 Tax=uncultured Bacteroides sp. TaxID=162156 RepID=UPI002AAC3A14|nr:DUF4270 domain-containing protein [uncultured Bacteroides sp.]